MIIKNLNNQMKFAKKLFNIIVKMLYIILKNEDSTKIKALLIMKSIALKYGNEDIAKELEV
jgi:hypothetical protein